MKKLGLLAVVLGGLLLVPFAYPIGQETGPFRVRVIDERTGAGVPNARVTVESGAASTTEFDGSVFTIEQRSLTTTVGVLVTPGGLVAVPVPAP